MDDETFQGLRLESLKITANKIHHMSDRSLRYVLCLNIQYAFMCNITEQKIQNVCDGLRNYLFVLLPQFSPEIRSEKYKKKFVERAENVSCGMKSKA